MITYLKGDATRPQGEGPKVIAHICNDRGGWGKGFVLALSNRWPEPEASYRKWFHYGKWFDGEPFELGSIQFVQVEPQLRVVNMIAQMGYGKGNRNLHSSKEPNDQIPLKYDALGICLWKLARGVEPGTSVHMPRIGTGLAGGKWEKIEPLIEAAFKDREGCPVFVYDL
jgi:O-acetyl-ADP-ribose deacetylase (regulator of RNase III)